MKRKLFGFLALAVVLVNGMLAAPVFASTSVNKIKELCSSWNGSVEIRGNAGTLCKGVKAQYSGACGSNGGKYDGSNCTWTDVDYSAGGNSSSGGSGSGSGSSGSGSSSSGSSSSGSSSSNSSGSSSSGSSGSITINSATASTNTCGGVSTSLINCNNSTDGSAIFDILAIALNVVTYGVGAAAVLGVVITGYQYMSARDNAAQVVKAKNRLLQVVIGLAIWVLFWGVLQFLLPGGLFANGS